VRRLVDVLTWPLATRVCPGVWNEVCGKVMAPGFTQSLSVFTVNVPLNSHYGVFCGNRPLQRQINRRLQDTFRKVVSVLYFQLLHDPENRSYEAQIRCV